MSWLAKYSFLSDKLIRNLFFADVFGSVEAGLTNFILTLYVASTYHNTFYLGLNLGLPGAISLLVFSLSAKVDTSDKKSVLVTARSLDFILMGLLVYVFLTHASFLVYLVIASLSSLAFNTMGVALSSAYRQGISEQGVAAELSSVTGTIFQVSNAASPIIVGVVVELTHDLAYTLLAVLALIFLQIYFFGRLPNLPATPRGGGESYLQSLREGFHTFRELAAKNRLYLLFTLEPIANSFLMGGSYMLVIGLLFGVKLFAFKLGLLNALGAAGTAAGTFLAGWVKPRSGAQVYLLYTLAFSMDVVVALFPIYPVIVTLLTLAGIIFYVGDVHRSAYQFVSVPKEYYARVSSFTSLLTALSGIVGALFTTYLGTVYTPDRAYLAVTLGATLISAAMLASKTVRHNKLEK